ncbi:acyl carrier protein [Microscilla marina]|uniref:Phosphopantetheine-binding, putative n=1 Tax=Microscilla marina ATCC 23134 TaxID=313606 RepID=A1ZCD7_MICM2|nr:acyl carrier protein [Microscilla marina]EAY31939.1 phosphopantetheine-binding, putative [Microscilla marina ATCC 23134]
MIDIKKWLLEKIAEETGLNTDEISCDEDFNNFDMDSLSIVSIAADLESVTNEDIDPTAFVEYNTINKFATWRAQQK